MAFEVLDQGPQAVAVGHHEDRAAAGASGQVGDDGVVPVGQHPGHHVGQALGGRQHVGRDVAVAGVAGGVVLAAGLDGRRAGCRSSAARPSPGRSPNSSAVSFLFEPWQGAVVALVQAPVAAHREPAPPGLGQGQLGRADGPGEHRGVQDRRSRSVPAGQQPAGSGGPPRRPPRSGRRRRQPVKRFSAFQVDWPWRSRTRSGTAAERTAGPGGARRSRRPGTPADLGEQAPGGVESVSREKVGILTLNFVMTSRWTYRRDRRGRATEIGRRDRHEDAGRGGRPGRRDSTRGRTGHGKGRRNRPRDDQLGGEPSWRPASRS